MADGKVTIDTELNKKGFEKGLSGLGSIAKGSIGGIASAIGAASSALAGLGGAAIAIGSDFEAGMSRVKAISGATEEEFQQLNDLAKQLGADTAFSASQAAEGMENLASAGFTAQETMEAMPGLLDLAAASGADLGTATEIAAASLRGFGLDASEAGHVANVFASAANKTNAQVEDMGEAMKYVAPVAKAMGQSLEDTAAAIGIMSDAGIKGGQAGTALRGMLSAIASPSKVAAEEMSKLGLSFYDAQGNMLPLAGIISELETKMSGLTQEQRNNALITIFGQEALSGTLALMDRGADSLTELSAEFQNSSGAAAEAAAIMQDNFAGAMEALKGSAETLGIEFYQSIQEPLKELAQQGTEYINQLTTAFQEGGISGLATELGTVLADVVATLSEQAPQLVELGAQLLESLLQGLSENAESIALSASEIVTTIVTAIIDNLPLLLQTAFEMIISLAEGLTQNLPELIPAAVDCIMTIIDGLISNIDLLVDTALNLVMAIAEGIIKELPRIWETAPKIIFSLISGLLQQIPKLIEATVKLNLEMVKAFLSTDWLSVGVDIISGVIDGILSMAGALWDSVVGVVSEVFDGVKDFFGIDSPSKLMRDEIGKMLPPGISIGFEKAMPEAERKMLSSYQDLVDRMEAAGQYSVNQYMPDIDVGDPPRTRQSGTGTQTITQINNFNQPVKSPAETARAVKKAGRDLLLST